LVRRQPLAGWQIFTPDSAHGAHTRLQQLVQPSQMMPSCTQPPAPVVSISVQVPRPAPAGIEQWPVQQSVERTQASPGWMQYEAPSAQIPLRQSFEQQSPPVVQGLPAVLQEALSGSHFPPVQAPLQHAPAEAHGWLSATHPTLPHLPPTQERLQQSVLTAQASPAWPQRAMLGLHVFVVWSQMFEQQWLSRPQVWPGAKQATVTSGLTTASTPPPAPPAASSPTGTSLAPSAIVPPSSPEAPSPVITGASALLASPIVPASLFPPVPPKPPSPPTPAVPPVPPLPPTRPSALPSTVLAAPFFFEPQPAATSNTRKRGTIRRAMGGTPL
jgi:hypothetical protein